MEKVLPCKACVVQKTRLIVGNSRKHDGVLLQIVPSMQLAKFKSIQQLLSKYTEVLAKPISLPPKRAQDHQIPLQSGQGPVSAKSYRYPHFQKFEIEKLVKEMLASGIIRPSINPYSSPVLLVKK